MPKILFSNHFARKRGRFFIQSSRINSKLIQISLINSNKIPQSDSDQPANNSITKGLS